MATSKEGEEETDRIIVKDGILIRRKQGDWLLRKVKTCEVCGQKFQKGSPVEKFLNHVRNCKKVNK
jgi:hypothetical protein